MTQSQQPLFEIKDLHVEVEGKKILNGVSLKILPGSVHAIMGRNGSGKSTLAYALMGHPKYKITQGQILLEGEDITALSATERARKRVFLGFQHPVGIPGVTVANFLRASVRAVRGSEMGPKEFRAKVREELKRLHIPESFMNRSINEGFSGGERKRLETLQLKLLEPKIAILDEMDSGLDIDALKDIASELETSRSQDRSFLLITHYQRLLNYIKPDEVHVFLGGKIVKSGTESLARELETRGYEWAEEAARA